MKKYQLTVAYRIYPEIARVPPAFTSDKLTLANVCLKSFKESLGSLKVKLIALIDGCPPAYKDLFEKYFDKEDLEVIELDNVGNAGTFEMQVRLLLEQTHSDTIYFAEDDYYYLPGQMEVLYEFLVNNAEADFATPLDHMDFYTTSIHRYHQQQIESYGRRWKKVASTPLTFMSTKANLQQTKNVFLEYSKKCTDLGIWFALTKKQLRNPRLYFHALLLNKLSMVAVSDSWLHCSRQILWGRRWSLWAPVPTIACHIEPSSLPPGFDWVKIFQESLKRI